ncbi:MAG: SDR family NAD(P)-dependent oxidoreductase [Pseudomonadota bacterium]
MSVFSQVMRPADGVAWITGASGGIGRALTLALAAKGWTVFATARREDQLDTLAAEAGGNVIPLAADVTDLDAMRRAVDTITADRPLALAVLNAGIYHPMRARNFDAGKARLTFDVNLAGVTNALEPVFQHMLARDTGHIAITASVAGYRGLPNAGPYGATKAGLIAMAESLALDLARTGVRLTVINPGFVETDATAVNEFEMPMLMQPEDAAQKIVDGLEKPGFEIRFPWVFALILHLIGLLPNRAYLWTVRKMTGWDTIDG